MKLSQRHFKRGGGEGVLPLFDIGIKKDDFIYEKLLLVGPMCPLPTDRPLLFVFIQGLHQTDQLFQLKVHKPL